MTDSVLKVKIKRLRPGVSIPAYATEGSAAVDLRAALDSPLTLEPGERALIPTGLAIEPEAQEVVALICARSGLSIKHGITLTNSVGVIDRDYRGEIGVALINSGSEAYTVMPDERIAQMMFLPIARAAFLEVTALEDTGRGEGGFGSTGKK